MATTETNGAAPRAKVLEKDYSDDFAVVTIKFLESGDSLEVNVGDLSEEIRSAALCHGLVQKLGDAAAGKSGDDAREAVMSVYERLIAGDWTKGKDVSGPRPSMVADAVMAHLTATNTPFEKEAILSKYTGKGTEDNRKRALGNAGVKYQYEKIKLDRQTARLAKMESGGPLNAEGLV